MTQKRANRKEEILQALAAMLETNPGQRITTARLAEEVGVSEAALYRHFPSKARMFEGLIGFIEDTLISRIKTIQEQEKDTFARVRLVLLLQLQFCEMNPGISRLLSGDALQGEHERLRERIENLHEKLRAQLKQILRERRLREQLGFNDDEALAQFLMAYAIGQIISFVRSDFANKPSQYFEQHWPLLIAAMNAATEPSVSNKAS